MKRLRLLIVFITTILLILGFYFFFPHVWGEIVYPLEHKEVIKKYANQWDVNGNLVAALIYTESRFNVRSTSGAGAMGLMQIMPGTGQSIAKELGESDYLVDKLYDPETNIRYGTWYIKGLLQKYNGNLDIALAAYNAGVNRADRWQESQFPLPYETVYFIQKVKNTLDMYDKIYGLWYAEPEVQKPNVFYQGIQNFQDFVKGLILGTK